MWYEGISGVTWFALHFYSKIIFSIFQYGYDYTFLQHYDF